MSLAHTGVRFTDEHKKRLSEANMGHTGYKHTPEARKKISDSLRTRRWTTQQRERFMNSMRGKYLTGKDSPSWKGGRIQKKSGYVLVKSQGHPSADKRGYVREHRLVVEKVLGRILDKNEIVHHKNGIKNDNRPENLEVVLRTTHFGKVKCPRCLAEFLIK